MKIVNGIISVLLGVLALYLMFINAKTDQDFILGFTVLMTSIVFMCFMIMGEQKDEIEQLRRIIRHKHKPEMGYGDESPDEYRRMLREVGK